MAPMEPIHAAVLCLPMEAPHPTATRAARP